MRRKFKEMKSKIIIFTAIPVVAMMGFMNNVKPSNNVDYCEYLTDGIALEYTVPIAKETTQIKPDTETLENCFATPVLDKSYIGFKEALAFKESRGDYFTVNTYGYLGKYQFGKNTLKLIGIYDSKAFLNDPQLQEKAFLANTARNKWILRRDIRRFVGKRIDGVLVTESGILAAAHLAGPGSVKKYLRSYGAIGFTDAYGTTIRNYMKRFSGYDTSHVVGDRKAKAFTM